MSGSREKASLKAVLEKVLELRLVRAYRHYSDRRGPSLADGVTYRALFSVFAGVLLGFSIAAIWLHGNPDAMSALTRALESVIPTIGDLIDPKDIKEPAALAGFSIAGAASLLGLIGAAIGAISSLRIALRTLADETHDDGFFLWTYARNLLLAIAFGGLLALAAVLSVASTAGLEFVARWFSLDASGVAVAARVLGIVIVFALDAVAIALVFRMLSGMRAAPRALWTGAAIGGVGLIVLQELSALFVRGATSNPLLGSFAALIALLLWMNLSAQVILLASSYIGVATADMRDIQQERGVDLARRLAGLAQKSGITIAVAESLTGGRLAAALSAAPKAGEWFRGGVVAYSAEVKHDLLETPPGPVVTAPTAGSMARSTLRLLDADWAVSLTGVGGPGSEEGAPAGTVYLATAGRAEALKAEHHEFHGAPEKVLDQAVAAALRALVARIELEAGLDAGVQSRP